MKSIRNSPRRGVALVAAIGLTFLVLALGAAMLGMTTSELVASKSQADSIVARNVAEAGAEITLNQWINGVKPASLTGNVQATVGGATSNLGSYSTTATEDANHILTIVSQGDELNAPTGSTGQTIRLRAASQTGGGVFAQGFLAKNSIKINGNAGTDSYNSDDGPYNSKTAGKNGDVRTDSTGNNKITINGNVNIGGQVVVGPGGDTDKVVSTNGNVTIDDGSGDPSTAITAAGSAADWPDIDVPTGATSVSTFNSGKSSLTFNGNGGVTVPPGVWSCNAVNLNGNVVLNTSGDTTLIVNGDFKINGNSRINVAGSLKIYCSGKFDINGNGFVNSSTQPKNLQLYGLPGCNSVNLNGNTAMYGVVYAPDAAISVNGNAGTYGSVVGDSINYNGNTKFHYDESLAAMGGGASAGFKLLTWEQM